MTGYPSVYKLNLFALERNVDTVTVVDGRVDKTIFKSSSSTFFDSVLRTYFSTNDSFSSVRHYFLPSHHVYTSAAETVGKLFFASCIPFSERIQALICPVLSVLLKRYSTMKQ